MPRVLSAAAFRALYSQETAQVFLTCVTITHPSLAQPLRFVYNNQPIERNDGTYHPALFSITLPEESADSFPTVELSIENIDRSITDAIRLLPAPRPQVALDVCLASSPNTLEAGPFNLSLTGVTYDAMQVIGTLGLEDDLLNVAIPADIYTPINSPGLFK